MSALLDVPGSEWSARRVAIPAVIGDLHLPPPDARMHALGGQTMGTTWSVRFVGAPGADTALVFDAIDEVLAGVIDEMSTWLETSVLSRFNRTAGEWMDLPGDLTTVLECALAVARDSHGAYDPTVGPLVSLWGFGPGGPRNDPPGEREIDQARAYGGWPRIELDAATRRARQPGGLAVDLSAIAKGFAVDAVAARLAALDVDSCLVEIGGELRGRGVKPDGQPWWVAIERPEDAEAADSGTPSIDLLVALYDLAVATSGDYRRRFRFGDRWYSHTIDPRTGRPVTHALASVTVLHRECMLADALSTAMTVLGLGAGLEFAGARGVAALFIERTARGLEPHASPALEAMLQ
jgi:thiamine biosynthesis lipoprotein